MGAIIGWFMGLPFSIIGNDKMKQILKDPLERERARFLSVCSDFVDEFVRQSPQGGGRPKFPPNDLLKALLIQSLHGVSFHRIQSDLHLAKMLGFINSVPKKSTLSKYMNDPSLTDKLERLIQTCAFSFMNSEDTLIVDSTWFATKMYTGGSKIVHDKANAPLDKVRKVHIGFLPNSKIIAYAKATIGTTHDCPLFKDIVSTVVNNGFNIDKLLADAGYLSKANYALCESLGIKGVFINFKSNITGKHPKSKAWRNSFNLYKNEPEVWHENYRYRVLIEALYSAIKKKFLPWLRTNTDTARDNESLLKMLAYNLTILGRYY